MVDTPVAEGTRNYSPVRLVDNLDSEVECNRRSRVAYLGGTVVGKVVCWVEGEQRWQQLLSACYSVDQKTVEIEHWRGHSLLVLDSVDLRTQGLIVVDSMVVVEDNLAAVGSLVVGDSFGVGQHWDRGNCHQVHRNLLVGLVVVVHLEVDMDLVVVEVGHSVAVYHNQAVDNYCALWLWEVGRSFLEY